MTEPVEVADDFVLPPRLAAPPRVTERHPWLFPYAVRAFRAKRRVRWWRDAWSGPGLLGDGAR